MRHLHTYPPIHTRYNRRARRVQRSYILETKLNSAVPLSLVVYFRGEGGGGAVAKLKFDAIRPPG